MRFSRFPALSSIVLCLLATGAGCKGKVTKAECARIVEHFIDLKLKENPRYSSLSAALKATVRAQVKQEAESDPDVQQAENRCEDENHTPGVRVREQGEDGGGVE